MPDFGSWAYWANLWEREDREAARQRAFVERGRAHEAKTHITDQEKVRIARLRGGEASHQRALARRKK